MGGFGALMSLIIFLIPLIIVIYLLKWVMEIRNSSEIQVQQNKEIISLLRDIKESHVDSNGE
ncbi:hypothetical protein GCM10011391_21330 [Pullulanibacillus camelliae]|uniref:Uncharacterized protein n=1 Tax=Pullulanibacillus camelliae TaxID=1707096 RepID=A0A8J2W3P0_9BACL|nr:hypothetical protein [Pullulanibacillus camelliae]GGE42266.1 hypothetical protein GCM10011391_21330 [Pullulanibacillus camelliae]